MNNFFSEWIVLVIVVEMGTQRQISEIQVRWMVIAVWPGVGHHLHSPVDRGWEPMSWFHWLLAMQSGLHWGTRSLLALSMVP